MCKGCFGRVERYERRAAAVFPKTGSDLDQNALNRLLNYSWTNTHKLPRIGRYLESRIVRDLNKRKFLSAQQGALVFNELQKRCHTDLALFYPSMEHAMKALLHSTSLDCRLSGVELFITFASLVEHTSAIVWDQDGLVHAFVAMANEGTTDHVDGTTRLSEAARQNQRIAGLRGLRAYFNLMRESPSTLMEWSKVLPTIFANLRYDAEPAAIAPNLLRDQEEDEEEDAVAADTFDEGDLQSPSTWTVPALGQATLRDVASIVPTADVKSFVGHALKILDKEQAWAPDADGDFAASALRTMVVREKSQDNQAAVERVLSYLDKQKDPAVKVAVGRALVSVLKDVPSLLSVHGLMRSLLKQLAKVDGAASPELQVVLADCVVAAASRAGPRQRIDALGQVNTALVEEQAAVVGRGPELSQLRKLYVVRCILPLCNSTLMEKMPRGREMVIAGLLASLVEATGDEDERVRIASFECMAVVLASMEPLSSAAAVARTPRSSSFDEADIRSSNRAATSARSRSSRSGLHDPNDHIWLRFDLSVKRAMYREVVRPDSSLAGLQAVLRLATASLDNFGAHDLVTLVPMLFAVQEDAVAAEQSAAQVVVAATLQQVSLWLDDEAFTKLVSDVVDRRAKGKQGSPTVAVEVKEQSVSLIAPPSAGSAAAPAPAPKKSRKSKKKGSAVPAASDDGVVEKITVFFERSDIVDALVAVDALLAHVNNAESSEAYGSTDSGSDDDGRLDRERSRLRDALLCAFEVTSSGDGSTGGSSRSRVSKDATPSSGKRGGRRKGSSTPSTPSTKGGKRGSQVGEEPTTPVATPRTVAAIGDDSGSDTASESMDEVTPRLAVSRDHAVSRALRYVARSGRESTRGSRTGDLPDFALLRRQAQSTRSTTPLAEEAADDSFDKLAARAEEAAATRASQLAEVTKALEGGNVPDWPTLRDSLLATGTVPSSADHPVRDGAMPRLQEEYACCDLLSQTLLQGITA